MSFFQAETDYDADDEDENAGKKDESKSVTQTHGPPEVRLYFLGNNMKRGEIG